MLLIIYLLLMLVLSLPGTAEAYLDPSGASIFWQLLLPVFLFIVGLPILFLRFIMRKIGSIRNFLLNVFTQRNKSK